MHEQAQPEPTQPTTSGPSAGKPMVGNFRRLTLNLIVGAVVVTGVVVYMLQGETSGVSIPMLGIVVVMLGAAALMAETVGYRTPALDPGLSAEEARKQSITQFQERMILRFAMIEAALIIAVVLAYVLDGGVVVPLVLAGVGVVALMLVHVYPGERSISKTQESLERGGATSYLRNALFGDGSQSN